MSEARLRPRAELDLIERTRYYGREGGASLAGRFFEAAVAALRSIERMPSAGSSRAGELAEIPGLRARRIIGFPCAWFYFVGRAHVDVVRLLADAQDLPTILTDEEGESRGSQAMS